MVLSIYFLFFPLCIPISSVPLSLSVTICEGLRWIADPFALITRPSWPQDRCEGFSSLCWSSELHSVTVQTHTGPSGCLDLTSFSSINVPCTLRQFRLCPQLLAACYCCLASSDISKTTVIKMPKTSKPGLSFSP